MDYISKITESLFATDSHLKKKGGGIVRGLLKTESLGLAGLRFLVLGLLTLTVRKCFQSDN